ncbi:MAG: PAS domain-containing protein [Archaeoglobaceae archaeon]|nr:PAS domain-containing protein [Archaeoglobaceae archaeon]MDW8128286.1 PAS domain-containing protein [Archaeoglobaceae archaeon]
MKPKIKIEIAVKSNRKLVEELLSEKYEISSKGFDLLIIDEAMLKLRMEEIKKLKSGIFVPILLLARGKVEDELWELVDEVVRTPIEKKEFLKRIEALLRARVQAVELKKHSEMLELELATLFDSIGNPVLILSPQFEILYANRKAKEILEIIGVKEFLGEKCHKIFHGTEEPIEVCPLLSMLRSGKIETREMEIPALGGSFVVTTTPIFENGELKKIIHIAVDVTPLREAEKELKSLFSEVSRLNELLRVIYNVNRQMVKRKYFGEVISDLVRELSKLGESHLTSDRSLKCVNKAIEGKEIVRDCFEDCKLYSEHKDKQVIAYPLEIGAEVGVLLFIAKRLRESEFELIKTLLEDVKFVKEKLELEGERIKLLEQLKKNIDEIAYLVDGIRNPLAVILSNAELFADEQLKQKIYEQVLKIDEIISRLDVVWIESEKMKKNLDQSAKEGSEI